MHRLKTLEVGTIVAALAIATFGAPAAAGTPKGKVAVVNGRPGTKVDICINGREIRSGLPYGGKKYKTLWATQKVLKVFKKDPRVCRGTLLAKKRFDLLPGDDLTIVVTRRTPRKVVVFDNSDLVLPPASPLDSAFAWRHAADFGGVDFVISFDQVFLFPWIHSGDTRWHKGDEWAFPADHDNQDHVMMLYVSPRSEVIYVGPVFTHVWPGYRYEWIVVGTKGRNAKVVTLKRLITFGP